MTIDKDREYSFGEIQKLGLLKSRLTGKPLKSKTQIRQILKENGIYPIFDEKTNVYGYKIKGAELNKLNNN